MVLVLAYFYFTDWVFGFPVTLEARLKKTKQKKEKTKTKTKKTFRKQSDKKNLSQNSFEVLNLFNLQHKYASKCKRFETNVVRQLQLHWQKVFMSLQLLSVDRLNVTSVFDLRLWHQNQLTHSEQRNTVCTSLLTKEAVTQTLCKADFASSNMLWQMLCMHTFTLWPNIA